MKEAKTTAENLEARFDAGEDVLDYFDLDHAVHPNLEQKRVNVDFPAWMVEELDAAAAKLAINRQAIIKVWLADRIDMEKTKRIKTYDEQPSPKTVAELVRLARDKDKSSC